METFEDIWQLVYNNLKENTSEAIFNVWFSDLTFVSFDGNCVKLCSSADFKRKILIQKFNKNLCNAFEEVMGFPVEVEVIAPANSEKDTQINPAPVQSGYQQNNFQQSNFQQNAFSQNAFRENTYQSQPIESQSGSDDIRASNYFENTFDTFVVGASNKFAHAAAQAVAANPGKAYNPLFIYGNSGLGKTHLLNAICHEIKSNNPSTKIVFTDGETFTNEFIEALRVQKTAEFQKKYRGADVLFMDDVQFIANKERTQEEFFHTFNALTTEGKQIVLSSDRPPKDMSLLEDRLRTRFEWGLIADIQPPDLETRMLIVRRKATLLNFDLPDEVVEFIAEKLKSNIRQLEFAVKKMNAYVTIQGANVNTATAAQAIKDILNDRRPTPVIVNDIINEVARTFNAKPEDLKSKKKDAQTSKLRQIAMHIVHEVLGLSAKAIGEFFGGRHYSTVLYGLDVMEKELEKDAALRNTVNDIIKNIEES